jgi:branched-chain amino acid transport system substrate-binding protein
VAGGAQTVAAWAGYVNSLGGLRCHPIKFITADDGGDPSRNEALTQQLVTQDGVVAFVYNDAPLASAGSESYLVAHHIPVIGTGGLEQFYLEHPNFFPQLAVGVGAVLAGMEGIVGQLNHTKQQHLGLLSCIEAPECSQAGEESPKFAHRLGVKIVYNGRASLTAPDYTAQCLAAKRAGVQVFTLVLDPSSIHRAAANCRDAGYTGQFATVSIVITASAASDPNLDNMVFGSPVKPWVTTSNPQIALMNDVLSRFAPGVSPVGSPPLGWTSAQLFAASSVFWPATDRITSADILDAMGHIKHYDVGGMTGPLTFVTGKNPTSTLCGFQMAIENRRYISPNNGARSCL